MQSPELLSPQHSMSQEMAAGPPLPSAVPQPLIPMEFWRIASKELQQDLIGCFMAHGIVSTRKAISSLQWNEHIAEILQEMKTDVPNLEQRTNRYENPIEIHQTRGVVCSPCVLNTCVSFLREQRMFVGEEDFLVKLTEVSCGEMMTTWRKDGYTTPIIITKLNRYANNNNNNPSSSRDMNDSSFSEFDGMTPEKRAKKQAKLEKKALKQKNKSLERSVSEKVDEEKSALKAEKKAKKQALKADKKEWKAQQKIQKQEFKGKYKEQKYVAKEQSREVKNEIKVKKNATKEELKARAAYEKDQLRMASGGPSTDASGSMSRGVTGPGSDGLASASHILCICCQSREKNTVIVPCGHAVLCNICADTFNSPDCPVCRSPVGQVHRMYLS